MKNNSMRWGGNGKARSVYATCDWLTVRQKAWVRTLENRLESMLTILRRRVEELDEGISSLIGHHDRISCRLRKRVHWLEKMLRCFSPAWRERWKVTNR